MVKQEKQIEEMAEVLESAKIEALGTIGSLNEGWGVWYAKALNKAGYRQINEYNEVVSLTLDRIRKETARDIIAAIKSRMQDFEDDDDGYLLKRCEFEFFMREIAKERGVEVDE